jgi:DNA processing protein
MGRDPLDALVVGDRESELAATVLATRLQLTTIEQLAVWIESLGSSVAVLRSVLEGERTLFHVLKADDVQLALSSVAEWSRRGLDVRFVLDRDYPQNLRAIFNKPPLLFVQGRWDELADSRSVAVVGTRKPTPDGEKRAKRIARLLSEIGVTVLSGLAAGIDTAAHREVLTARGRTVAVLGSGFDYIYPVANRALASEIVGSGGAVVSQFPPDHHPARWTFPLRNVVMSGLSLATIVVEAGETSGARIQARSALQHGRTVFLLRSLVHQTPWAKKLVSDGMHGVTAIEVSSPEEITERLVRDSEREQLLAV